MENVIKTNELNVNDLKLIHSVLRKFPLEQIEETYNKVTNLIVKHEQPKDEK